VKSILLEAVAVAALGILLAFVANGFSPRGLQLTRDYFPNATRPSLPIGTAGAGPSTGATNSSPEQAAIEHLRSKGLQVMNGEQVLALFHDVGYEQGLIAFIDARSHEEYLKGHIPGAYEVDYMDHPEKYLGGVLPACSAARQIVVYCHGGDCELSEFTAELLRNSGVPNEKLFIYTGGITEWEKLRLPQETGERKSGQFRAASK